MAARHVPIDHVDRENPALRPYLAVRDRDLARTDGLFVAEGEVVVRVLASPRQTQFRVRSLLVEQRRVEALADVLDALHDEVSAYIVPQALMDAVVGFAIHRGILALAERGAPTEPAALLAGAGTPLAVGLVGLTNHDNVGSVFRNAAAFGARAVLLDPATCDPLYRKAIRVSVGGALVVPFARATSTAALFDTIEVAGWEALALSGRGGETLQAALQAPTTARGRVLVLGTEGDGLPEAVLARTRSVRIDMAPTLDSLNVAVASGIALYEASKVAR